MCTLFQELFSHSIDAFPETDYVMETRVQDLLGYALGSIDPLKSEGSRAEHGEGS